MSTFGQAGGGAGGGAPGGAAGGTSPASTGAPAPGQQQQGGGNEDPWGFQSHVAGAPEHLRPMLQTAFEQITPQLQQRFDRYSPLDPFVDRLQPLLEPAGQGDPTTPLEGLLNLYGVLTGGEETQEQLYDWWDQVGQSLNFFDDEEDGTGADGTGDDGDGGMGGDELSELRQQLADTRAQLDEFRSTTEQRTQQQQREAAVTTAKAEVTNRLNELMTQLKIDGAGDVTSPAAQHIVGLALKYNGAPDAIDRATADYMAIKGGGAAELTSQSGEQLTGIEALQAQLAAAANSQDGPGPTLQGGMPSTAPTQFKGFTKDANAAALARMTGGGPGR